MVCFRDECSVERRRADRFHRLYASYILSIGTSTERCEIGYRNDEHDQSDLQDQQCSIAPASACVANPRKDNRNPLERYQ